jgi:hypothetical protein
MCPILAANLNAKMSGRSSSVATSIDVSGFFGWGGCFAGGLIQPFLGSGLVGLVRGNHGAHGA